MQYQNIPETFLDSFTFVVTFLVLYFTIFMVLYFLEVGVDEILLWKVLANIAVLAMFASIVSMFFLNPFYQGIPFFLLIVTFVSFFWYNWLVGKEDTLYVAGSLVGSLTALGWLVVLLLHALEIFEGFRGGEYLGISPTNEGPTFSGLVQGLLSPKEFSGADIILMVTLTCLTVASLAMFLLQRYVSYIYLQGRPSSTLWLVLTVVFGVLALSLFLKFPPTVLALSYLLVALLSLFTTYSTYVRSKMPFYLNSLTTQGILILVIGILVVFYNNHIYISLTLSLFFTTLWATLAIIRDPELHE